MLRLLLTPLPTIARELQIMRELYEADLNSRQIFRVTESPKVTDTSVSYAGVDSRSSVRRKWEEDLEEDMRALEEEDD